MAERDSFADRISELERWRERAEPVLTEITDEQKIARGVAEELRRRGIAPSAEVVANRTVTKIDEHGGFAPTRISLTWYQRAGAFFAGAILLADAVRGLVS